MKISQAEINGESTFGMKDNIAEQNDLVELKVKSATKVLGSLLSKSDSSFVDLLHVNCEVNYILPNIFISVAFFNLCMHRAVNGKC